MPYPIASLPYPFRRRLRQLLSSTELLSLQIASGNLENSKHLLPVQTYRSVPQLCIGNLDDDTVELKWFQNDQFYDHNGSNLLNSPALFLDSLNESNMSDWVFHYVWLANISSLEVANCTITEQFLTKLSCKQLKPTTFSIQSWSEKQFLDDGTKFSYIFTTFPLLETCYFQYSLVPGWVKHMVEYGKTNLKRVYITENDFHKLFSFKAVELYQFVKAQNDGFQLHMWYNRVESVASVESKVLPLFEQYFEPTNCSTFSVQLLLLHENIDPITHDFALRS
uniref:F-box domain-containing protein n=1 Tax=Panagrellus redivivus TaxID=6233 RepID=A0A7E4VPI8_PANRE